MRYPAVFKSDDFVTAFRFCQADAIETVLSGNDALVVMPTGGGKSVCYQIPPLVKKRTCLVVSPLISLMEDQVQALNLRNIPACYLGSAQSSKQVKDDAMAGKYMFVYVTPELAVHQVATLQRLHATTGGTTGRAAIRATFHCASLLSLLGVVGVAGMGGGVINVCKLFKTAALGYNTAGSTQSYCKFGPLFPCTIHSIHIMLTSCSAFASLTCCHLGQQVSH